MIQPDETSVLWCSRHIPKDVQIATLEKGYGTSVFIDHLATRFTSPKELNYIFRNSNCQDMVLIAPDNFFIELTQQYGYSPIKSIWVNRYRREADIRSGGIYLRFIRFERVLKANLVLSEKISDEFKQKKSCIWFPKRRIKQQTIAKLKTYLGMDLNAEIYEKPFPKSRDIFSRVISGEHDVVVVSNLPLWLLANLKAKLPNVLFIIEEFEEVEYHIMNVDYENPDGVGFKFTGFSVVHEATWETEIFAARVDNNSSDI